MELSTCYCPNQSCSHYGVRGFGRHLVHRGSDNGIPRLRWNMGASTVSGRHGTAYFDLHAEERIYTIAMRALAEGNSLRGTGRILDINKDTVCDWLDRGGGAAGAGLCHRQTDAGER
ncbi:MAG: hypothetical protein M5U01_10605 [Ardenticatenaceae bacterium]|nr:hypothetical protein [Ardenticatenaceae bacterium]HBY99232.1 hypothetical protein [Chloroflexota bacterium]